MWCWQRVPQVAPLSDFGDENRTKQEYVDGEFRIPAVGIIIR